MRNTTSLPGFPDQPSDGTVSVAETIVPRMMDFLQVPRLHTTMIWNSVVWEQTEHFLRTGEFSRGLIKYLLAVAAIRTVALKC
ncbi:MAG: hypothetical protein P8L70_04965 [Halioglobus sp.]|nr:hypothetical protein [Halioglobus sp.]MDG2326064.1 hypothetical protein [Halioglobus sp.]